MFARNALALIAAVVFMAVAAVTTAGAATSDPLPVDQAFELNASRHDDGSIRLQWQIAPGYYLYKDKFGLANGEADLPLQVDGDGESMDDPTFGQTTVFHDRVEARIPRDASARGQIEVRYQGCQEDGICYPPVVRTLDPATLTAVASESTPASGPSLASEWTTPQTAAPTGGITLANDGRGMVGDMLEKGGAVAVLGSFLVFGALLAFTPCVFPMYPILAGAIAREGETVTRLRGFTLSLAYVIAMATAFGLLGVVAAWSGQNLQMALQSPAVVAGVSVLFLALALSMFGLFELQLPSAWIDTVGGVGRGRRGSVVSAAVLGFTSALIVGPCVTAPLAGALLYIAQTGDVALGAAGLFALGLGKGIPLMIFGTFGPAALPKAGVWMTAVRQAFGFVFLATATWMISRLVPAQATLVLWALVAIGVGVWLGAFDALRPDATGARRTAKAAGLAASLYAAVLAVGAASGATDPLRPLEPLTSANRSASAPAEGLAFRSAGTRHELDQRVAEGDGRPSLLYVTADWCVSCAIIDRNVLSDPSIRSDLASLNLIEIDVSKNRPEQQHIMQALEVVGPPTMIFVDATAEEVSNTRLVGDVTKATLRASIAKTEALR